MDDKITIRLSSNIKAAIGRVRTDHPALFNSTQAACRHIIVDWLQTHAYLPNPGSVAPADVPASPPDLDDHS
jgi:hypothetical protein